MGEAQRVVSESRQTDTIGEKAMGTLSKVRWRSRRVIIDSQPGRNPIATLGITVVPTARRGKVEVGDERRFSRVCAILNGSAS